jgi:ferrochelatase
MSQRFRDGVCATPAPRTALLLVNLGTPDAPTPAAVRRYLGEFLHDYRVVDRNRWLWCPILHGVILPLRAGKVAKNYAGIWGPDGSPLRVQSQKLAAALQAQLPEFDVRLAMRYGAPSIASVLREWQTQGLERLLVLPLYPQYSATTTASVHDAVFAELSGWRKMPELRLISDYHQNSDWLDALEASVEDLWDMHGRGEKLLISFHGIPQRFARAGDPYPQQCEIGARLLAERLGLAENDWSMAYQSRFGREPWLQPYIDQTLTALAEQGVKTVDVVCPGFAVDCLETLEEIAVQDAELFRRAGGRQLRYVRALNASPGHVSALSALARRHAQGWTH